MELGGYLTWTALAREINKRTGLCCFPYEQHGNFIKLIKSPIFYNNPHFAQEFGGDMCFPLQLNLDAANYCQLDTPEKAIHKSENHIIETVCKAYGVISPQLKCELFLTDAEKAEISVQVKNLPTDYVVIEPVSNEEYTINRAYPFHKWQSVVNALGKKIAVVQVGMRDSPLLNNVIDLRGKTSFRTCAGIIKASKLLLATEGGLTHLATCVNTCAVVVVTGYQSLAMVEYPQHNYVNIARHGPCGLKKACPLCEEDGRLHDPTEIIDRSLGVLGG